MKKTTIKDIINDIELFVENHKQLNGFKFGKVESYSDDILYPFVYTYIDSVNIDDTMGEFEVSITLTDLAVDDNLNVISNLEIIARDFLNYFWDNIQNQSTTQINTNVTDDNVIAVTLNLVFDVYTYSCIIPAPNLEIELEDISDSRYIYPYFSMYKVNTLFPNYAKVKSKSNFVYRKSQFTKGVGNSAGSLGEFIDTDEYTTELKVNNWYNANFPYFSFSTDSTVYNNKYGEDFIVSFDYEVKGNIEDIYLTVRSGAWNAYTDSFKPKTQTGTHVMQVQNNGFIFASDFQDARLTTNGTLLTGNTIELPTLKNFSLGYTPTVGSTYRMVMRCRAISGTHKLQFMIGGYGLGAYFYPTSEWQTFETTIDAINASSATGVLQRDLGGVLEFEYVGVGRDYGLNDIQLTFRYAENPGSSSIVLSNIRKTILTERDDFITDVREGEYLFTDTDKDFTFEFSNDETTTNVDVHPIVKKPDVGLKIQAAPLQNNTEYNAAFRLYGLTNTKFYYNWGDGTLSKKVFPSSNYHVVYHNYDDFGYHDMDAYQKEKEKTYTRIADSTYTSYKIIELDKFLTSDGLYFEYFYNYYRNMFSGNIEEIQTTNRIRYFYNYYQHQLFGNLGNSSLKECEYLRIYQGFIISPNSTYDYAIRGVYGDIGTVAKGYWNYNRYYKTYLDLLNIGAFEYKDRIDAPINIVSRFMVEGGGTTSDRWAINNACELCQLIVDLGTYRYAKIPYVYLRNNVPMSNCTDAVLLQDALDAKADMIAEGTVWYQ